MGDALKECRAAVDSMARTDNGGCIVEADALTRVLAVAEAAVDRDVSDAVRVGLEEWEFRAARLVKIGAPTTAHLLLDRRDRVNAWLAAVAALRGATDTGEVGSA
jgi:hypothetical protein